jgi:hypothetical protein
MKTILVALVLFPFFIQAQNTNTYFEKKFGTAGNDVSRSVKQLSSGSIFILGNSTSGNIGNGDISLIKLDKFGNEIWTEYYGSQQTENAFYLNTTNDGNLVFVAESETSFNDLDILIYKVDTSGNVIWNKTYATSVNESPNYIEQTMDGGYIICGYQNDTVGSNNSLVLKLDANGNYQWHQSIGEDENDISKMIHQLSNGNYILTADTRSYGAQQIDVALYELDSNGNQVWMHLHGDSLVNGCQGLIITSTNDYLSYGETEIFPNSPFDFFVEKMNANGSVLWHYTYGGMFADAAFSAVETSDGGFLVTGYSNSYNNGAPIDLVVFKIDVNGNFLWQKTYGSESIDIGYEIIKSTTSAGFIIVGYTTNSIDFTPDYYLLHINENGLVNAIDKHKQDTNFTIYPNPVSKIATIEIDKLVVSNHLKVIVNNVIGEVVKIVDAHSNQIKLDVDEMKNGIYFINLVDEKRFIATQKLIICK